MLHVKLNFSEQQSGVQNVKNESYWSRVGVNFVSKCTPICTRVVYNSNVKRRNIVGLLARGNKVKKVTTGVFCQKNGQQRSNLTLLHQPIEF